ncbi:MAG: hypothetical protein Q9168_007768 [Polycauliona sp. 1 TL-2023]
MRALHHIIVVLAAWLGLSTQGVSAAGIPSLEKYTIAAEGINASFIAYGARVTNLLVKDRDGISLDIVLGYDEGSGYINDTQNEHTYFGAAVGRYAGRMKNGTYTLNRVTQNISKNENDGLDSLHGGKIGYDQRNWTIVAHNDTSISFMLEDNAFEGFPGQVVTYATYSVSSIAGHPTMTSRLVSISLNEPTPIMLTTHPYFNLNAFVDPANPDVLDHTLHMPYSHRYVKVDNIEVPTGEIGIVKSHNSTRGLLDFITPATLGASINANVQECGFNCTGIDTNFIIDRPPSAGPESPTEKVLTLSSNTTGIKFDLYTNQQALIVYTCNKLEGTIPLKKSQQHAMDGSTVFAMEHGCVAIETQGWIDGINHPEWGQQEYQVFSYDTLPDTMWAKYVFGTVSSSSEM